MDRDHAPDPRLARHDSQADEFAGLPAAPLFFGCDLGRDEGTCVVVVIGSPPPPGSVEAHAAAARKPPKPLGFSVPVLAIGTLLAACALAAILITILEHLNR